MTENNECIWVSDSSDNDDENTNEIYSEVMTESEDSSSLSNELNETNDDSSDSSICNSCTVNNHKLHFDKIYSHINTIIPINLCDKFKVNGNYNNDDITAGKHSPNTNADGEASCSSYNSMRYRSKTIWFHSTDSIEDSTFYAISDSLLAPWLKCRILSGEVAHDWVKVQILNRTTGFGIKMVLPHHLAQSKASIEILKVGTRVIAKFNDPDLECSQAQKISGPPVYYNDEDYRAGIVGDSPHVNNNHRYLVFFDNGRVQYVLPHEVFCVFDTETWQNCHANSKNFMKFFLEQYHEDGFPTADVRVGFRMIVELNSQWLICRVIEVDFNLVKVQFESNNVTEWLFKGSPRIQVIWHIIVKRMKNISGILGDTVEKVVLSDISSDSDSASPDDDDDCFRKEAVFKLRRPKIQAMIRPRQFIQHRCSGNCLYELTTVELQPCSGILKPLMCGWDRVISQNKRVYYNAPCGRQFKTLQDIYSYLCETESDLSIECFTFEVTVNCRRECQVSKKFVLREDLSNGLENIPIAVVNNFTRRLPKRFTYTLDRIPYKNNTSLNVSSDFLSCCDCEDDCSDKTKCHCWQLTLAGQKYAKRVPPDEFGYKYKRLYVNIYTGIYECNSKCKCNKSKCLNRVVQHPTQVKLQCFRTNKCGWGLRCVNDIPRGTFICNYVGDVITEKRSNYLATKFEDAYIAALGFIENCTEFKDDYEAEVLNEERNVRTNGYCEQDDDDDDDDDINTANSFKANSNNHNNNHLEVLRDIDHPPYKMPRLINQVEVPKLYFPTFIPTEKSPAINPTRRLFGLGDETDGNFVIDGNKRANIARFINHSCNPNLFLQHIFVDTHDIRFPWLALFADKNIKAGTELTWDYNYEIDSVPGRELLCKCNSKKCRRRLL